MNDDRHSEAEQVSLVDDPIEEARRESANAVAQFDRVTDLVEDVTRGQRPFRMRPSIILDLHRIALEGLSPYAGNFRPGGVSIGKSKHTPPAAHLVPGLIEEMCERILDDFGSGTALRLCAYVMWRLNWIHPFTDGNGRTSRSLAYYVLCAKVGYLLPGQKTVPEQIAADKQPYYRALEAADASEAQGALDLSELETLLGGQLAEQLLSAYRDAHDPDVASGKFRKLH